MASPSSHFDNPIEMRGKIGLVPAFMTFETGKAEWNV
jgi:hypothetical protein